MAVSWTGARLDTLSSLKVKGQFVYRCWAADGTCLYVGGCTSIYQRFVNHRNDVRSQEWLNLTVRIDYAECPDKVTRYLLEDAEYQSLVPAYNRQRPFATEQEKRAREYARRRSPAQIESYRRRNREYARRWRAADPVRAAESCRRSYARKRGRLISPGQLTLEEVMT